MKKQKMLPELILSLQEYSFNSLLKDCIAGIIVGIIALPLSIALSIASGAGPEAGLITAIFAGGTAALFGGSKFQISGPTGAFVVIVFGIIGQYGLSGLMMATLMAGIIIILMGVSKAGRLIKFIPLPIITGFTAGIALTIFIGQLNDFLGMGLTNLPAENVSKLIFILKSIQDLSWITMALGFFAVLIIVLVPRLQKLLPGPLIAILICTVINMLLPQKTVTLGDIYGTVNVAIKPQIGFFVLSQAPALIIPAFTIAFLAAIESLLSAVVADGMTGAKHNPDMELVGQGLANVTCSMFGGLPATGAIARTSANIRSGGATPIAALIHSVIILVFSLFLMPYAKYIPMTVFAAVLFVVCYNMLNIKEIKKVLKTNPIDISLMALTFILTVIFDLVVSIIVCTSLSLIYQLFKRFIKKQTAYREQIGNTIKVKGHVCYMNYDKVLIIKKDEKLDMSEVKDIDATATDYLINKAERKQIEISSANKKVINKLKKHKIFENLEDEILYKQAE